MKLAQKEVFILGAKPDPVFPKVSPTKVYAANGAIYLAQRYVGASIVTGLVAKRLLIANEKMRSSTTSSVINGCKLDRLLICGGAGNNRSFDSPEMRGVTTNSVQRLSRFKTLSLKMRYASWRRLFANLDLYSHGGGQNSLISAIIKTRSLPALGISSGLLATLVALSENKDRNARFHLIGISLNPNGGHFHDVNSGPRPHLLADQEMIKDLYRNIGKQKLIFTDPDMQEQYF